MPQEKNTSMAFTSSGRSLRGPIKALSSNGDGVLSYTDDNISDYELAQRKAEEAAARRYQAAQWLREMDNSASETLSGEPSEEDFRLALRNGLILCNVLNKVNPGSVPKVVENPVMAVQYADGAAHSAIQYFENMRNFLMAVKRMQLLTFEASDLEKGGSSSKVVDCILCLKGFYEWKQSGGTGIWRYGGTVKITAFNHKVSESSSVLGSESADESASFDESESSQYEQLLEFLHLSNEIANEESETATALSFLFDSFGLQLLKAYLKDSEGINDFPLNATVIDALLGKVIKDFSSILVSQGTQLGLFLKKVLKSDVGSMSRMEFIEVLSRYLAHRKTLVSRDISKFCVCDGKSNLVVTSTGNQCTSHGELIDLHQKQLEEMKSEFQQTRMQVKQVHSEWKQELRNLEYHVKGLEVASSSYHKVLEENRMLYNQVQDLKGTIRVYCRVRPFLQGQSNTQSTVDYIGENGNIMIVNPFKQGKDARKIFTFNKVLGPNVSQEQIYTDTQPLIRSVLDGFNVCIFAYGQTGSGKTYTMSGPDLMNERTWGVNYRALRDLFQLSGTRTDIIKYEVGVQMIEIYNEQVRDLLVSDGSTRRLDIRNNSQLNGLNVPDASLVRVASTRDVLELMRIGQRNRAVGATALNERSSRSHSVLTVHVQGKEMASGSILRGCLHLVDLAGSERVDKSEAVGERLKEAQHINRSLSALGDVISALAQKSAHVPYRNSKLTQVLQDSLGGQAKTLMFMHINPEVNAIGETISTLKFAERVASIELGAARSNKETGEIRDLKEEISNLKQTLEKKEAELEQWKSGSVRITTETQKARAVSPFNMSRYGSSSKADLSQRPNDGSRIAEARSCSSGKQRRSRFPSALADKDPIPKMLNFAEERDASSKQRRSPSPPVRRSISTDRGSVIRCKNKPEATEPASKVPFPARVPTNKSFASGQPNPLSTDSENPVPLNKTFAYVPSNPSSDNSSRVITFSQDPSRDVNVSNALYSLQKISSRQVYTDHEDQEMFRQALNVRQGGVRKSRAEGKNKAKNQMSGRFQKLDVGITLLSEADSRKKMDEAENRPKARHQAIQQPRYQQFDVGISLFSDMTAGDKTDDSRKSDSSETENEQNMLIEPAMHHDFRKLQRNYSRNSQHLEQRLAHPAGPPTKFQNGTGREGSNNTCVPELKRSRSTPRGKLFLQS